VPAEVEESQAERVRQSLVMLDVHLPAIALPDGVHCRAFVGAAPTYLFRVLLMFIRGACRCRVDRCRFRIQGFIPFACSTRCTRRVLMIVLEGGSRRGWPAQTTPKHLCKHVSSLNQSSREIARGHRVKGCVRCGVAGNGVIVHHSDKLGLVVTDRNTASVSVGDVRLSFGAHPAEVEGRIRFLHPLHNFAILSYNPADLPPEVRLIESPCKLHAQCLPCCGLHAVFQIFLIRVLCSSCPACAHPTAVGAGSQCRRPYLFERIPCQGRREGVAHR
jgi:hypothetical protein